jgi:preprotein translocase subunit YajC
MGSIAFLIIAFGAMYFIMIRPQQQRTKMHEQLVASLEVGDEVLTSAGIYGMIVGFEGDGDQIIQLEIADGVVVSMNRASVVEVAVEDAADEDAGDEDEA